MIILSCVAVIAVGGGLAKLLIPESKPIVSAEVPDGRLNRINPILLRLAAEKLVEENLRDPDSAIFSDETIALGRNGGSPIVCGWVNSRNGFGGMSGPQRFIVGSTVVLEEASDPVEFGRSWINLC